jgi:glycerophosphoryl diester phosphodiesterase
LIVAHRGASGNAPENTLPAFCLAWEQGADAIEGDVHLVRDGGIVCIHDRDTGRLSDRKLIVKESTVDDLKTLDVGKWYGENYRETSIPTIEDVFRIVPERKKLYIEIKCGIEIIPVLIEKIERSGLEKKQVTVLCFDHEVIREFKRRLPLCKALWLYSFKKSDTGISTPLLETVVYTLVMTNADGISSNTLIPEPFIDVIIRKGFEWHVWTVDNPGTAWRMKALGAYSITTNVPEYLCKSLPRCSPGHGKHKYSVIPRSIHPENAP